jgi:hypothetical protein
MPKSSVESPASFIQPKRPSQAACQRRDANRNIILLLYRSKMAGCPDNRKDGFCGVSTVFSLKKQTPEVPYSKGFRAFSWVGDGGRISLMIPLL